jgi:EAL domain-containing protein (putative c-di-GMP-specific phosphodiesterase class I)
VLAAPCAVPPSPLGRRHGTRASRIDWGAASNGCLHARLRAALLPRGREPFALAFQPVVNLSSNTTTSFEALIRWNTGDGPPVPPAAFVPLAERTGLVPHLDRWTLRAATEAAAAWEKPWSVAVNVSARTFGTAEVVAFVGDALAETGLPPSRLIVEMTETALAADETRARHQVEALRALGVGVVLDDFGQGHASLAGLRRFPFSGLKLDRTLIDGIDRDPVAARIVGFAAELGAMIGASVVAEGVECAGELSAVREAGAGFAQGFYLGRPVDEGAVAAAAIGAAAAAGVDPPLRLT